MGNYLTYDAETNDLEPFIPNDALANAVTDIQGEDKKIVAINSDIDRSEGEVNSYLSPRYKVPILAVPTPPEIVDAAGVLAVERIYNRGSGPPQKTVDRAAQIRTWLKDIGMGKAGIPGADASPTVTTGDDVVITESEPHQLTRTKLGFLTP